ncbi:MAG TPA: hypothetical protein VK187_12140, partial [Geobacteraceae bacterium]|nr:hypothetical protein [Geobacteraceae bacterium]
PASHLVVGYDRQDFFDFGISQQQPPCTCKSAMAGVLLGRAHNPSLQLRDFSNRRHTISSSC